MWCIWRCQTPRPFVSPYIGTGASSFPVYTTQLNQNIVLCTSSNTWFDMGLVWLVCFVIDKKKRFCSNIKCVCVLLLLCWLLERWFWRVERKKVFFVWKKKKFFKKKLTTYGFLANKKRVCTFFLFTSLTYIHTHFKYKSQFFLSRLQFFFLYNFWQ